MAFTAAVNEGPIPEEYVDQDVVSRTLRIYLTAKVSSTRDFLAYMKKFVPQFEISSCQAVWKTDTYGQIFITMKDAVSCRILLDLQCVQADKDKIYFYSYGKFIVPLRIHWLHATVRSAFLKDYFAKYGKVIDVYREFEEVDGEEIYSGVRIVKMELNDDQKAKIPHIVKFGDKQSILITAPGRLPVCLKCHTHGHVRAKCPKVVSVPDKELRVNDSEEISERTDSGKEKQDEVSVAQKETDVVQKRKPEQTVSKGTGKKKKGSEKKETASQLNWAEQVSQSDVDLAAMDVPEEYTNTYDFKITLSRVEGTNDIEADFDHDCLDRFTGAFPEKDQDEMRLKAQDAILRIVNSYKTCFQLIPGKDSTCFSFRLSKAVVLDDKTIKPCDLKKS